MADTYDVIICGAGPGGGFMAGQIAPNASVLILDAGPHFPEAPNPGIGVLSRRKLSAQMNLGTWIPSNKTRICLSFLRPSRKARVSGRASSLIPQPLACCALDGAIGANVIVHS